MTLTLLFFKITSCRRKRDASEGKTFLDFFKKGGNEEIQELSSILRISDINDQRYLNQILYNLGAKRLLLQSDTIPT